MSVLAHNPTDQEDRRVREQLEKRVTELEAEYRAGQEMFTELEARRANLQQTLLRIGGAIQVLNELLEEGPDTAGNGTEPATPPPGGDLAPAST
jgi:predicted nuclease with TOPRIM domain